MKMQSCALMNGQHQQIGPSSQPSQATPHPGHDPMRNQQSWAANSTIHYTARNIGVQNARGGLYPLHNGAYSNRPVSNLQTSAGPSQGASSQQTGGGNSNNRYFTMLLHNLQNSSTNTRNGNPRLPASGFQVPTLQDFHQNSATQSPPNPMNPNATYPQQNMSVHWKQSLVVNEKQMIGTQNGRIVTDIQHVGVQKGMYQNINGDLTKLNSAYTTTATSLPPEQALCTSTMSASEHSVYNVPIVNNQIHGQNGTQRGFSPVNPPSCNMATSQPFGNKNIATRSLSCVQNSYHSSISQKTPQYRPQHCLTHNGGMDAAISRNSNSYKEYETMHPLAKKRDPPINPAATQQQVLRRMVSADSLCNSYTTGSYGHPPPPVYSSSDYREQQSVKMTTVTVSNQSSMQPGTSAASESYNNLNATQFLPCHSGQSLPKSTQSVTSRKQHTVSVPPQQNSVPNVFDETAPGNRSGITKANSAFLPNKKCSLIGLLSGASLLMQLTESISPQRNKTQSSGASGSEMHPSVQQNDSSIHSSPGHTGTKAVAVVQPLPSLESCQIPSNHASCDSTTADSLNNPEKIFISQATEINREAAYSKKESNISPKSTNHTSSKKSAIRHSTASSGGTFWSASDSGAQNTKKQSELDVNVAPSVQNSVPSDVPANQNSPKDQSGMQTLSTSPVFDLSSLPTTLWTTVALINLIRDAEKAQKEPEDLKEFNTAQKILDLFWDGSLKTLHTYSRKTGFLQDLVADVKNFCRRYLTADSAVLLQVNGNFEEQMKSYHVLKDGEVFSELPYRSSWLNVNEQLDEIDKEFGFPLTLKYHILMRESDGQKDRVNNTNSIPAPIVSEVPNKVLPLTHFEPVDSGEEKKVATLEAPSTQTASPNKTDSANDPCLSLKIQVLPPEEAKRFYEHRRNEMPQSIDTDSQAEVMSSSMESETPDNTDTTSSESKLENGEAGLTELFCCLARLVEIASGSSAPSLCKCQCQSHEECTNKTLDNGETVVLKHNNQSEIISGSKVYPAMEGEDPVKGRENIDNQIVSFSGPELCSFLSNTIDLTEDDDQPQLSSDQKPKNISQITNTGHSSIILISDEDEDLSNSENEILSQRTDLAIKISEHEDECGQEQLKSTETKPSGSSVSSDKMEKFCSTESKIAIRMSNHGRNCEEAPDVAESPLKIKGQTQISAHTDFEASFSQCVDEKTKRKRKRLKCHNEFVPPQKESKKCDSPDDLNLQHALDGVSKCEKELVCDTEAQNVASKCRTVELVLFGSAQQDKCVLTGGRKTHSSSPKDMSNAAQRPPEVLTVNLNTLSGKSNEAMYRGNYSVKQMIHEKWWRSFQPTKAMYRNKLKILKRHSDSTSAASLKNDQLPVSSEMVVFDGNTKHSLSLKMERSHNKRLGKEKTKDIVADQKRTCTKNESQDVIPHQENNILRFSVLPTTFDFKDGSSGRKESTYLVSGESDFKEKEQNPNKAVTTPKGKWCPSPQKNYSSLRIPKTFGLFHEYQKKYKERTQPSKDE